MTIAEAVHQLDALRPNAYPLRQKLAWLSNLESMVKHLVLDAYEEKPGTQVPGFDEQGDLQQTLLIPAPFDSAYVHWLESRLHYANEDMELYNNAMALFRAVYEDFRAHCRRTRESRSCGRFRF